jgi:hypothetical protein
MNLFRSYYAIEALNMIFTKKCDDCANMSLFDKMFPINLYNHGLINNMVKWKIYEYVVLNHISSLGATSKKIDLLEDGITITNFM